MNLERLFILAYLFGAAWLLGWELAAFTINSKLTISDFTWTLEGPGWSAVRFFIAAALIWLTLHLSLGWFK